MNAFDWLAAVAGGVALAGWSRILYLRVTGVVLARLNAAPPEALDTFANALAALVGAAPSHGDDGARVVPVDSVVYPLPLAWFRTTSVEARWVADDAEQGSPEPVGVLEVRARFRLQMSWFDLTRRPAVDAGEVRALAERVVRDLVASREGGRPYR